MRNSLLLIFVCLVACGQEPPGHSDPGRSLAMSIDAVSDRPISEPTQRRKHTSASVIPQPVREPVSEKAFAPSSAQGAANVVQTYFALLEAGDMVQARKLTAATAARQATDVATLFKRSGESMTRAVVGPPARIEGAAGSLYVSVPVQIERREASKVTSTTKITVDLRRSNHVPGSKADGAAWRIIALGSRDSFSGR